METLPWRTFRQVWGDMHVPSPFRQLSARMVGAVKARRASSEVNCILMRGLRVGEDNSIFVEELV